MFKRFLITLVFFGIPSFVFADYIVRDISVRDALGGAYDQNISLASSGKLFDVKLSLVSDNTSSPLSPIPHRVSLTLPGGLQYVSYTLESSDCSWGNGFNNPTYSNASFNFEFTPNTGICESIVRVQYRTNGIAYGPHTSITPNIRDAGSDGVFGTADDGSTISTFANTVTLNVITKNPLLSARTVDMNGNGFIDAYDLTFGNILSGTFPSNSTNLTYLLSSTPGVNLSYTAGSFTGRLSFADSNYGTDAVPSIDIPVDAAYQDGSYFVGVCQDGAAPAVTPSLTGGTYTGALSISLSASESGTIRYATTGTASLSSPIYTGSPIVINANTTLSLFASDIFGNSSLKNVNYSFVCGNTAPANGSLSAYPTCAVSCNSGYTLKGAICEKNSVSTGGGGGGGGGGGWIVTPPNTSTGTTSTGATSTGTTNPPNTSGGGWNSTAWTSGSGGSVENPYVTLVPKVAKDGLFIYRTKSVVMSKALLKFENKYLFKINAVYMSKSINAARYKETIQAYNRFVLYASMWRMDRPLESYKNEAIKAYNIFYKVYRRAVLPSR